MNQTRLSVISILLLLSLLLCLTGCEEESVPMLPDKLEIVNFSGGTMEVGDVFLLVTNAPDALRNRLQWSSSSDAVYVDSIGRITAMKQGNAIISVKLDTLSTRVLVKVVAPQSTTEPSIGPDGKPEPGPELDLDHLPISPDRDEFYGSADPADSYEEALERSARGELSGALTVPDQAPTVSANQPEKNGKLIRNSQTYFLDSNTYIVVDSYGREVFRIYRGGGYITLEEVAAYVYAFGNVPANYDSNKKAKPYSSIWGEYLRVNHTQFSGDTSRYPYEPALPRISGCGGDLYYYEIDIGTTGTDCDPSYDARIYNNGSSITRGAARIVYTRYDRNRNEITDPNEKFVFYTYNHYNDFQEYLNYYGGWGAMFGNVTGGGTLSSKYDCNPTPYVETVLATLPQSVKAMTVWVILPANDRKFSVA